MLVCEAAARHLKLEHGIALSIELHASCDLALMDLQYDLNELPKVMRNDVKTMKKKKIKIWKIVFFNALFFYTRS